MPLGVAGWIGVAGIGANLIGSSMTANAAENAANTQANATMAADAQHRTDLKPWTDAGTTAIGQLSQATSPGGQFTKPFTMADAANPPAETYAQQQAMQASQNSAAARGGLIGTNEQHDLQKNAAGIGSQFQNQAFNQWLQTNQQQLNALQSVAQVGQSSAMNVADSSANLTLAGAASRAAGGVASTNATVGGISSLSNQLTTLGQLFGTNPYTSPNASGVYANPTTGSGGMGIDPNGFLGGPKTAGDYSDERLKEDIKRVGTTDDGLPIFTYRMKGGNGKTQMGVMAQDVEEVKPSAVSRDMHGYKMVDYSKVR